MNQTNLSYIETDLQNSELGLLALEVTLIRYMIGLSEEARINVQAWLDSNVLEEDFLSKLITQYPDIANILADEINLAKENLSAELK